MLSHPIRKLEWIWYIFQYSIFVIIYFQSTNSLLLFGYIDLKLMKDQILLIKILKLMIHIRSPVSCKIIHQVCVQTLICVCISITSCKNKIVHFRGAIWTFSALSGGATQGPAGASAQAGIFIPNYYFTLLLFIFIIYIFYSLFFIWYFWLIKIFIYHFFIR